MEILDDSICLSVRFPLSPLTMRVFPHEKSSYATDQHAIRGRELDTHHLPERIDWNEQREDRYRQNVNDQPADHLEGSVNARQDVSGVLA